MTKTDIHKKAMLEALEKSLGVVTTACKSVGIARNTHYEWMKEDEEYKKAAKDVKEIALDFAESQLHQNIRGGNVTAQIFFLKTQGKKRGYIERQEITGADGDPINKKKKYDLSKLNEEDKKAFLKITAKIKS